MPTWVLFVTKWIVCQLRLEVIQTMFMFYVYYQKKLL